MGLVVSIRVSRGNATLAFHLVDKISSINVYFFVEDDNYFKVIFLYLCSPPIIFQIRLLIKY